MPPEPLPWDRKEFVRKHERSETFGSVPPRWRDSSSRHRDFVHWGSEDLRRTPGYGKQGGYQPFSADSVYVSTPLRNGDRMQGDDSGFRPSVYMSTPLRTSDRMHQGDDGGFRSSVYLSTPLRTADRMVGDENSFRPSSVTRGDGRYVSRYSRESRGSFSQKEWKGSSWEVNGDASGNRQHDTSAKRSVSDLLSYSSRTHSDVNNSSWDHQNEKMGSVNGFGPGHRHHNQPLGPMSWKSLKWTRSTSLSSRGSGFSHTSSSKSTGADSDEHKLDSQSGRATPVQSPPGDAAEALASSSQLEDTCPKKKPRLGWGQGLAKYEKQKVEGSDETCSKNGLVPCSNNTKPSVSMPSLPDKCPSNLVDKSPRITGLSECASPATTSSVACGSPPGLDEKQNVKLVTIDTDTSNLSGSPGHGFRSCLEGFSIDLENLESTSVTDLNSLLGTFLQVEDASFEDSNFVKSSALNKLLLLKCEFSKALEKTESEIDLYEGELKQLSSESEANGLSAVPSASLQLECASKSHEELGGGSKVVQKPVPLLISSSDMHMDAPILFNGASEVRDHSELKNEDIDSPGTATSKFVEPLSIEKASSTRKPDGSSLDVMIPKLAPSDQHLLSSVEEERSGDVCGSEGRHQQCGSRSRLFVCSDPIQEGSKLHDLILDSNREIARRASEEFSKLLPCDQSQIDVWASSSISCQKNKSLVKEKLAARKCFQRFKEKVLTLKFRSLQHLWKEDMRLNSIRKYKAKSHKKIEFASRTSQIGHQKHRSSIRSRFTSPAGSLTLVPTADIVDYTSKLLSGSQIVPHRSVLKMPALILDEKEKTLSRFITTNGLVEDPCALEKERLTINPWTPKEKEIFLEMLATLGKDFKKIASFLDHKTTADCIEFYYKNHKSESFQNIKKKSDPREQERSFTTSSYLMTSGKKWNRELNAASLDLLGAASVIAAQADDNLKSRQNTASRSFLRGKHNYRTCMGDDASYEKTSSADVLENEREAAAADALAGICGALSSEAMSSCVTSSVDPGEACQEWKLQRKRDRPLTPKVMQVIDDEETCSDESYEELDSLDWTDEEKSNFIAAVRLYGKDFVKISRCVRSRSMDQCKIFFGKSLKLLCMDMASLGSGNEGTPVSDANGGRSDTDDGCVLELDSAICSTHSCSKVDVDMPLSSLDTNCETMEHTRTDCLQTEPDRSEENNEMEQFNHDDVDSPMDGSVRDNKCIGSISDLVSCGEEKSLKGVNAETDATQENLNVGDTIKTNTGYVGDLPLVLHERADLTLENQALQKERTDQTVSPDEESLSSQGPDLLEQSMSIEPTALPSGFAGEIITGSEEQRCLVAESRIDGFPNVKIDADSSSGRSSSGCFTRDSTRISPNQATETNINQTLSVTPKRQPEIPLDYLPSVQKAHTISWKEKENCPAPASFVIQDSPVAYYEDKHQKATSSSTLNFDETGHKQHQKTVSTDLFQPYLSCHSLNMVHPTEILRGYPLHVLNKKDLNGHAEPVSSENHSIVQSFAKVSRSFQSSQFFGENFQQEKGNSTMLPCSVEHPFLSQNNEQSSKDRAGSHSQGSSDNEEHSRRSRDFKLFGQIVHPSTSTTNETENSGTTIPKSSSNSNLKFSTDHGTDRLDTSQFDSCTYLSSENLPKMSFGFWDGNRIHTGLSSLPDSSLLKKYPVTFSEYASASSHGDQQSLPALVKRNDRNLGSVSVYPSKDVNVNGTLPDYHLYRSFDGFNGQTFAGDVNRHNGFCELQRRNGLDISNLQQQARGVVGMNVMAAGILLGGGCTGVSDPVAAIKMHYAATERYGGQTGSVRQEDSWRGDIGR